MTAQTLLPTTPGARPTPSGRALRAGAGFLLVLYSVVMLASYRVPYILQEPGSAENVLGLLRVEEGVDLYKPKGQLLFLTVSLSEKLTLFDYLLARFDDDAEVIDEDVFTGDRPRDEVRKLNLRLMQESKLVAIKVGLEQLGYQVKSTGHGALVTGVGTDLPASGKVRAGDVIVAVDGRHTPFAADAKGVIVDRAPGAPVTLTIRRNGKKRDVTVKTAEDKGKAVVGVTITDNVTFDFPITVDIDTGQVGGPSAGLAFALAVIDELTPGELTGGKVVAITGTIGLDGAVGEVGGVEQKAVAARREGAVLMLVPKGEVDEARLHAGDMKVRGVADIEDAIDALVSIGGNGRALAQLRG